MSLLASINSPADLAGLTDEELRELSGEIRERILQVVSRNGGHLSSNLGAVELTVALAKVFHSPDDRILWDVGHQSYTWKLLTGRDKQFDTLRQFGGISGFPKCNESPYDAFVAGHAGNAVSAALGMAAARDLRGTDESVVAVVGDACIANGMSFEALNNVQETTRRLIVVLNDNEMSISENVGAVSRHLGRLLSSVRYNRIKARAEQTGHRLHMTPLRDFYHRAEQLIKSIWLRNALFEEFGMRYIGPVDGHDIAALTEAFTSAKEEVKTPVLLHVFTRKGQGYKFAERSPSCWHGVGPFDRAKGLPSGKTGYSERFGEILCALAERDPKIVAITAAMMDGTGLAGFAQKFPNRFFDVGICEAHGVTFAAGLAQRGLKPVFAVYSSFLQRAVDNVMHDVCLQNLPVVLAVDRAGVVGADGPTHHGVFDIPMLRCLPNLSILQPVDADEMRMMFAAALERNAPVVIRYPRGVPPLLALTGREPLAWGRASVADADPDSTIFIWCLGDFLQTGLDAADRLRSRGKRVSVVNARFVKPLDSDLLANQAKKAERFITIENGSVSGGFGSAVREALSKIGVPVPVQCFGWGDEFIQQGTVPELVGRYGLSADAIVEKIP